MKQREVERKIDTNTQKREHKGFTWFGFQPTSTGGDKKKFH